MRFIVILEKRWHGAAVGSTEDVFEADGPREAERLSIRAWRLTKPKPGRTFAPLLTVAVREPEEAEDG
ncbi:MAG: hypothetical protein ACXVRJ_12105 [Gaiellaceae bacterium]